MHVPAKKQNSNSKYLICNYTVDKRLSDRQKQASFRRFLSKQKEKLYISKQHSSWLHESPLAVGLVIPFLKPRTSSITIQVPNPHTCCALLVEPHDNYDRAYYQKSALAKGSGRGLGEGEENRGMSGIPIKPVEHPQTKAEDTYRLLQTGRK